MRWADAEAWIRGLINAVGPEQAPRHRFTLPDAQARPSRRRGALDREVRIEIRSGQPGRQVTAPGNGAQLQDVQVYIVVRLPRLQRSLGNANDNAQIQSDAARLVRALHRSERIGEADSEQTVTVTSAGWSRVTEPDGVPAARISARIRYEESES